MYEGSNGCGVWAGSRGWIGVMGKSMDVISGTGHTIKRDNGERPDKTRGPDKTRQEDNKMNYQDWRTNVCVCL